MTLQKVIHEGNVSEYQSTDCEPLSKTSKSEDIWYQNTSGNVLVVMSAFSSSNYGPEASIHVNSTESDRRIMRVKAGVKAGEYAGDNATFMVPNGHYYKVKDETPSEAEFNLIDWTETSLI